MYYSLRTMILKGKKDKMRKQTTKGGNTMIKRLNQKSKVKTVWPLIDVRGEGRRFQITSGLYNTTKPYLW